VVGSLFSKTAKETADWIGRGVRIFMAGSDKRMIADRLVGIRAPSATSNE